MQNEAENIAGAARLVKGNAVGRPNILFIMTDQQRFDTIAALGNAGIYTPNLDRLVQRGVAFTNAYSTCPVCVPARYNIRTGREPFTTGIFQNELPSLVDGQPREMEERCGTYLARRMGELGYRTFGIGKFHTIPHDEDIGYEAYLQAGEMGGPDDHFVKFIAEQHPEYRHVEQLHGERTNMYYVPQLSPLPAELTMEAWAADRAIEQMSVEDERPFFGFVSFIGPHPPCAPPIPYNRMYDPDRMPDPILGDPAVDGMDERIPWNNYFIYAEDISAAQGRNLRSRYYGEVSFIDACIGRILDAVEARPDAEETLICFFADHGDHLGDHGAWQKGNFFEGSCHVPMLVSWPARLGASTRRHDLVNLTDLFGLATAAAGCPEFRDGIDLLGLLEGRSPGRTCLFGFGSAPGHLNFRLMVRRGPWKYNYMANGGREQLFNLAEDPNELVQRLDEDPEVAQDLRRVAVEALNNPSGRRALDGSDLLRFPATKLPLRRCKQFNRFRGVTDFPDRPGDVL